MKYLRLTHVITILGTSLSEEEKIVLLELEKHVDEHFELFRTKSGKNVIAHIKSTCEKKHRFYLAVEDIRFILRKMRVVYRYFQSTDQAEINKLEVLSCTQQSLFRWLKKLREAGPLRSYFLYEQPEEIGDLKDDVRSSIKKVLEDE